MKHGICEIRIANVLASCSNSGAGFPNVSVDPTAEKAVSSIDRMKHDRLPRPPERYNQAIGS